MAKERRTISEKTRRKLGATAIGAAIVVGLAQAPACSAEEHNGGVNGALEPVLYETPEEAFAQTPIRNGDLQGVFDVYNISDVKLDLYKNELNINVFHPESGLKELLLSNQQFTVVSISNAQNLTEFKSVDEYIEFSKILTRNSESYGYLDIENSKTNNLMWDKKYKFDDTQYGRMYRKIILNTLQKDFKSLKDEELPEYKLMATSNVLRLEFDNSCIEGLSKEQVIGFVNYITAKTPTAKVDLTEVDIKMSLEEAPSYAVLGINNIENHIVNEYNEMELLEGIEREDIYISLEAKGAVGNISYDVRPRIYNKVIEKLKTVKDFVEPDMLNYNEGLYIEDTIYMDNLEKGLEYQKSIKEKGKETACIFENEDMGVYIDESESQESQVLVMLNEYLEIDEENMIIEDDHEGLEQENV